MRLPIFKTEASATIVSKAAYSYLIKRSGPGFLVLLLVWSLFQPAYAQGDTGPAGLEGLDEALVFLAVFPFLAIGLSFLIYKATGKAWVFFFAPFIMAGLSVVGPANLTPEFAPSPAFFLGFGAWAYGAHLLAVTIVFSVFSRTKRLWLFVLAPILGWVIQFISFLFIVR